jgi:hypothetical protein
MQQAVFTAHREHGKGKNSNHADGQMAFVFAGDGR